MRLTILPNGSAVDLSTATIIEAADASEQFSSIKPRVIIKWFHDNGIYDRSSYHECQIINCETYEEARKERDRLIEIANRQKSKTVLINARYYRSSDVMSVTTCGWDGSKWSIVAHVWKASNDGTYPIIIPCESESQGNELARELMEQVAGVRE